MYTSSTDRLLHFFPKQLEFIRKKVAKRRTLKVDGLELLFIALTHSTIQLFRSKTETKRIKVHEQILSSTPPVKHALIIFRFRERKN